MPRSATGDCRHGLTLATTDHTLTCIIVQYLSKKIPIHMDNIIYLSLLISQADAIGAYAHAAELVPLTKSTLQKGGSHISLSSHSEWILHPLQFLCCPCPVHNATKQ